MRDIRQNLLLALVYDILGLPMTWRAPSRLWLEALPHRAAAAMNLSSLSVIGNDQEYRTVWSP